MSSTQPQQQPVQYTDIHGDTQNLECILAAISRDKMRFICKPS